MTMGAPVSGLSPRRLVVALFAAAICLGVGVWTVPVQVGAALSIGNAGGAACAPGSTTTRCLVKRANALRKTTDYAGAIALSRRAIAREPLNLSALETLARSVDPQKVKERGRLIESIATLSKHSAYAHSDLLMRAYASERPADLWYHADVLLRWAQVTPETVYEVLLPYLSDERGRLATARKLASDPPWRADFLRYIATKAEPRDVLSLVATLQRNGLRLTPGESESLVSRLLETERYDDLRRLRGMLLPKRGADAFLYDGGFEDLEGPVTLVWTPLSVSGGEAVLGTAGAGHPGALLLRHDLFSSSDWMVRQLALLTPGRYRLSLAAQGLTEQVSGRFVVEVACRGGVSLVRIPIRAHGEAWVPSAGDFAIPPDGCPAQWIAFAPVTGDRVEAAELLVDRVRITQSSSPPPAMLPTSPGQ